MPNKILNVSCSSLLSGTPVQNNQVVAKAYTTAAGTIATNYVSAAGATGLGTGMGVAVGTYFSNKLIISHLDKIESKLKIKKRK